MSNTGKALTREAIEAWRDYLAGKLFFGEEAELNALCDMALSALSSPWQPIETAPRDGTHFIAGRLDDSTGFGWFGGKHIHLQTVVHHFPGYEPAPSGVKAGFYASVYGGDQPSPMTFTHWMPLPPTPAATEFSGAQPGTAPSERHPQSLRQGATRMITTDEVEGLLLEAGYGTSELPVKAVLEYARRLREKVVELEENERAYERILGPRSYNEVAEELKAANERADTNGKERIRADLELAALRAKLEAAKTKGWNEAVEACVKHVELVGMDWEGVGDLPKRWAAQYLCDVVRALKQREAP